MRKRKEQRKKKINGECDQTLLVVKDQRPVVGNDQILGMVIDQSYVAAKTY